MDFNEVINTNKQNIKNITIIGNSHPPPKSKPPKNLERLVFSDIIYSPFLIFNKLLAYLL